MKISTLEISGLKLITLSIYKDGRGFFMERFNKKQFQEAGLPTGFVQDNHSRSAPGVLRGLHYQNNPSQGKLVGVLRGRIWDITIDLRPDSLTYGKFFHTELNDENGKLLWIPGGFAHGFCVLGNEPSDVLYKVDAPYQSQSEGGILWNDPDLNIPWPIQNPILSPKDQALPLFREV